MKFIVIQGRMPQDGSKAATARIIFPDWLSPTLVCAGIIGRVQELTDGNILEGGKLEERIERYAEIIGKGVLADDIGEWVRYEDHVLLMAALRDSLQVAEAARDALHLAALKNVDTRTPAQLPLVTIVNNLAPARHDPLRLEQFDTLEEAQAAHDALADKYDEMHEMLIQRTTQRDALYATALNNLNTLRDK